MAIQATGAMSMIVADVPAIASGPERSSALFTLAVMTGLVMLAAGLLRLGWILRFVSNAVMVGFINAIGVNIVLGQLADLTGYAADGANRIVRALDTVINAGQVHLPTLAVGLATIALILLLERTRLGALGLVVAVAVTSVVPYLLGGAGVATLHDIGVIPSSLPRPELPELGLVPALIVPALSLAFVGLIQGASISATYPEPDGSFPNVSRDFIGQGAANVAVGLLQGMPVGGSLSASALNKVAGARSRVSLVIAGLVMAIVILAFGGVIAYIAMPALAGLLMLIGYRTIKPDRIRSVWRTGLVQKAVLTVTFVLTMIIPLQFAVLVGVGLSVILHTIRQSNQVTIRRQVMTGDGHLVETDSPPVLPADEVVILQPYGSLFFAAAPVFEAALPAPGPASVGSVVIVRLRGGAISGRTFMDVLRRYAALIQTAGSRLVLASTSPEIDEQLRASGLTATLGPDAMYPGDERIGAALGARLQGCRDMGRGAADPVGVVGDWMGGLRVGHQARRSCGDRYVRSGCPDPSGPGTSLTT